MTILKHNISRIVLSIVLFFVAVLGTLALYTNIFQQRSLRSWAFEKFMFLVTSSEKRTDQTFQAMLDDAREKFDAGIQLPDLSTSVKVTQFKGRTVYTWNDKKDSNQKVIFYIHGGGFMSNPTSAHFKAVDEIANATGAKVVFPIYEKVMSSNVQTEMPIMQAL